MRPESQVSSQIMSGSDVGSVEENAQTPKQREGGRRGEVDDLKAKVRLLERKRLEDREKIKGLDKVKTERDRFEGIIQKLQSKIQPQQQELADMRKELAERHAMVAQLAEAESLQEMMLLDKEMAEEMAETLKSELDGLRLKHEELELESSILREENDELSREISPEDKTSQGWLQLEKSNGRLREALLRLRDVSQEQESQLQAQIRELEMDVRELGSTKEELDRQTASSDQARSTIDELRQQLETAQGAEDMIEDLTDKNMSLSEKIEELKGVIDDLESLKELNDELELNHIETERQLQEEIDYNDNLLHEEARKATSQDSTIQDLEYTVSRFRELVNNMQSDLADLQASKQISEAEANELTQRSQAMMDLNQSLRSNATKVQSKTIEQDLINLRSDQASDRLSILSHFVPQNPFPDREGIDAYVRFRALKTKCLILLRSAKDRCHPRTTSSDEDVLLQAEVVHRLAWLAATFARFIALMNSCSVEEFRRLGAASQEVQPVERSLDNYVDSVRRDEFDVAACAADLKR